MKNALGILFSDQNRTISKQFLFHFLVASMPVQAPFSIGFQSSNPLSTCRSNMRVPRKVSGRNPYRKASIFPERIFSQTENLSIKPEIQACALRVDKVQYDFALTYH